MTPQDMSAHRSPGARCSHSGFPPSPKRLLPGFDGWASVLTLRESLRLKRSTKRRLPGDAERARRAFSLIELIVVVGVMLMLMGLAVPAFSLIKGGNDFAAGVSMIANSLEQSRAHAMAHNTYVFWGIQECNANLPEEQVPQEDAGEGSGYGRVAVGAVVSLDGTRIYDPNAADMKVDWETKTRSGGRLMQLGNILWRDGVSLATNPLPGTGNLLRPSEPTPLQISGVNGPLSFSAPQGVPKPRHTFTRCIQFDPQGGATVVGSEGAYRFELGIVPARGAQRDPNAGNVAVLQVDSATGSVKIYRP